MKQTLLITLMLIVLPSFVFAESDVLSQLDRNKYSSFKTIESFKIIKCIFRGNGAEKNGLSKEDLTDFIRLKFENNMAGFPYKEMTDFEWKFMTRNELSTKRSSSGVCLGSRHRLPVPRKYIIDYQIKNHL